MSFQLSEMVASDYDEVLALWQTTKGVGLNESDTRENVEAYLLRNPGLSLAARHDGRIVGAVLCGHDGRRGFLNHLAVNEEHRKQGLGHTLVQTCLSRLGSLGILKCNIYLYVDNEVGERFWKNGGWAERADLKVLQKVTSNPHDSACNPT